MEYCEKIKHSYALVNIAEHWPNLISIEVRASCASVPGCESLVVVSRIIFNVNIKIILFGISMLIFRIMQQVMCQTIAIWCQNRIKTLHVNSLENSFNGIFCKAKDKPSSYIQGVNFINFSMISNA